MTITFENDNDVVVYALEKIISFAREYQYFFVANCTWWIASIYGLDNQLRQHIDYLALRQSEIDRTESIQQRGIQNTRNPITRGVSPTPRDIARDIGIELSPEEPEVSVDKYISDPLRRTRKGRVNPLPQTKKQLKKARQKEARRIKKQANTNTNLTNLRENIIGNLLLE